MSTFKPKLVLLRDTREQLPLEFKEGVFDEIQDEGLPFGDYHCQLVYGENIDDQRTIPIIFERKTIPDLFNTLTRGHDRFKRMLSKVSEAHFECCLLIEGSIRDVVSGFEHSTVDGNSILKTVFTFWLRYGVYPVFCNDRREMARFIEETYEAFKRNYSNKKAIVPKIEADG